MNDEMFKTDDDDVTLTEHGHEEIDRKVVLKMLESALGEAHRKIDSGRVRDEEKEKVRQKWCRTLGYLAAQFRQLNNDKEIEGLKERIERLEQQREHGR